MGSEGAAGFGGGVPLLNDFHVKGTEKAQTETRAEGGRLRCCHGKRRVCLLQALQSLAKRVRLPDFLGVKFCTCRRESRAVRCDLSSEERHEAFLKVSSLVQRSNDSLFFSPAKTSRWGGEGGCSGFPTAFARKSVSPARWTSAFSGVQRYPTCDRRSSVGESVPLPAGAFHFLR